MTPLLDEVESLDMRFYKDSGWSKEWDTAQALPKAVGITFTLKDYGKVEKIYLTAGETLKTESVSEGTSEESSSG